MCRTSARSRWGVQGRPQLDELAMGVDSPQRLESILAVKQIVLHLELEFRPAAAHIPDVVALGVIDAALVYSQANARSNTALEAISPIQSADFLASVPGTFLMTGAGGRKQQVAVLGMIVERNPSYHDLAG